MKKSSHDIWGETVNTASRMESSGEVGQVNISDATCKLVREHAGSLFHFTGRGKVQAKGKGELGMWFVDRTFPWCFNDNGSFISFVDGRNGGWDGKAFLTTHP